MLWAAIYLSVLCGFISLSFLKTFRLLSGIFRCNTMMFSTVNCDIFRCDFDVGALCSYGFEEINVGIF